MYVSCFHVIKDRMSSHAQQHKRMCTFRIYGAMQQLKWLRQQRFFMASGPLTNSGAFNKIDDVLIFWRPKGGLGEPPQTLNPFLQA